MEHKVIGNISFELRKDIMSFKSLTLKRLSFCDIELVREWRNSERVRKTMCYRDLITKEQQVVWFNNLNADSDYYYLVFIDKISIGLVNLKGVNNIDAEAGVFIGNESFDGKGYGFAAVFLINYFAFNFLGLEKLVATILEDNKPAIRFNKSLGYTLDKCNDGICKYVLFKDAFKSRCSFLENMVLRVL